MSFAHSTESPNTPAHILHISTAKSWRGGEQQLAYLLEETVESEEFVPHVLAFPETPLARFCESQGISLLSLQSGWPKKFLNPFYLKRLIQQLDIDLIHLHDAHGHTLAVKAAVFERVKTPVIVTRRVDFPVKSNWLSYYKYNHPIIKKIICISEAIKEVTGKSIKEPEKLEVVHSGIDLNRFQRAKPEKTLRSEYQLPDDTYLIGNTSALADHKDYYTFVDTAEQLLNQGLNARFFIIGTGPESEAIRQYIEQKDLSDFVIMTGFRKDIENILPELDVYLMTSKTEGLGTSVLDAMACGVPVVATTAGGIPEMIVHEKNGLLSPVGDADDLALQVLNLVHDIELRDRLVEESKKVVKKFSKANMASGNFRVYREILGI